MTRKTRKTQAERLAVAQAELNETTLDEANEARADTYEAEQVAIEVIAAGDEAEAEAALRPRSVVKTGYKRAYAERAAARGNTDKASKRGNGDWLQRELQGETIGEDGKFLFDRFVAILDANGVDYSRWSTTTKGWEGRFRMSGSLVLRGRVGKAGVLRTPDGETNLVELAEQGDKEAAAFLARWAN
jgi:hypothetical protein